MWWLTSDEHFNHANVIQFCNRPFSSVEHMNSELIRRHNERVKPGDTCFHLGDFRMTNNGMNTHELLKALNGNHVLIQGNHCKRNGVNTPLRYAVIETYGMQVLLIHRPEDAEPLMKKLGIGMAFVGHVHDKWKFKTTPHGDLVNGGVDQWCYYPVDAKQILKAHKKWKAGMPDQEYKAQESG